MKRLFSIIIVVFLMALSIKGWAQDKNHNYDWRQKIKVEKIAFLTSEMDLTPAEAQVFWPVYNKAEAEKSAAFKAIRESYKALLEAEKASKGNKEIANLLKAYLDSTQKPQQVDAKYAKEYEKILPAQKVAKLFIGEENFRKLQMQRLNDWKNGPVNKR